MINDENEWGNPLEDSSVDIDIDNTEEALTEENVIVEEESEDVLQTPELEGIETKGAEKRIRQLIKQRKDRDDELLKAKEEINQLRYQMSEAGKLKFDYDGALADSKENELKSNLENARTKFKEAYDTGNKITVLEAQEEIADATAELKLVNQRKEWIKQQSDQYSAEQERRVEEYKNTPRTEVDPLAAEWAETNKWFGKDRTATAVALSIDAELKREGRRS